jgi:hypothetical protein
LEQWLIKCLVMVVVIGPDWLDARGEHGRRLDDPTDWVRLEITQALAGGVTVIPVTVCLRISRVMRYVNVFSCLSPIEDVARLRVRVSKALQLRSYGAFLYLMIDLLEFLSGLSCVEKIR